MKLLSLAAAGSFVAGCIARAAAATLTVGLAGAPAALDPARSTDPADRVVLTAVCDGLIGLSPDAAPVPALATDWQWSDDARALTLTLRKGVRFQDGTPFDAAVVKANLERSAPRGVRAVEVIGPATVRLSLGAPDAPLVAALAGPEGMMLSPNTLGEGSRTGEHPVCAGPFGLASRAADGRVTLDRFAGYWNAAAIGLDRMVFRPIPDGAARLAALQSGAVQLIEQVAPADAGAVRMSPHLRLATHAALAYRMILFNLANGAGAGSPLGRNPLVREALEKALDRATLNQAAASGVFVPNNQAELPFSRYWDPDYPVPGRDVDAARIMLARAGLDHVAFTLLTGTDPLDTRIGQTVQAMAAAAGFDIGLRPMAAAEMATAERRGDFQAALVGRDGSPDPDGNLAPGMACDGALNFGQYLQPPARGAARRRAGDHRADAAGSDLPRGDRDRAA